MERSVPNSSGTFQFWPVLMLKLSVICILIFGGSAKVWGQPPDIPKANTWMTDGTVFAIATDGGVTYIGGDFKHIGPFTANGVPINEATGFVPPSFSKVKGTINAVVPDGAGGWFIGGDFTDVGGQVRNRIAHLLADNSLDISWEADVNGTVWALAVSGGAVYVAGDFTGISGEARNYIAALDAETGQATAWNPNANGVALALAVSGGTVYVGGGFTVIGDQYRNYIAALDATTGQATAWNPNANGVALALAVSGETVYAGGVFTSIGGQARNNIAALDAETGQATVWNPNVNNEVLALAVSGGTVYVGGWFTTIGAQARNRIGAIDVLTGEPTAWDPNAEGLYPCVLSLAVSEGTVYAGGRFWSMGGQTRNNIAALDVATGEVTPWNPNANYEVKALAVNEGTVYAGGRFWSMGGQARNNIAAIDALTGEATGWNPSANAQVYAMKVSGGTVYVGGAFSSIGGQARNNIAAVDALTGEATSWNPDANFMVWDLAVSGGTVYVGGAFTEIGGQDRTCVAALDALTSQVTSWNPNAGGQFGQVNTLAVSGGTVYAGGYFTSIGEQERHHLAAFDEVTGQVTPWNPNADGTVYTLAVIGGIVYVGGFFSTIGGEARSRIAAVDAATGKVIAWDPKGGGDVWRIVVNHGIVYSGGDFGGIGSEERHCIAALDATTGEVMGWNPNLNSCWVRGMVVNGGAIYVGGGFPAPLREFPCNGFVQFGVYPVFVSPFRLDFGALTVGSITPTKVLTFTNALGDDLAIDSIHLTGPNSQHFVLHRDLCSGTTLAPSGNCSVEVAFAPRLNGLESAYVTIASNTPKAWTLDVPVTGTGEKPIISVTPSSLDFGTVPERASIVSKVSISNVGTLDLLVGTIALTGTDALEYSLQNDSCSGHTVASSSNCSIEVVFSPLSGGLKSATLNIPSNDPDTPAFGVSVTGTGVIYPKVTLLSPNGGEAIPAGSTYVVIWGAPSQAVNFKLQYSIDNGATWETIGNNLSGMTHEWKVATPLKNKETCLVRVTGYKASGVRVGSDKSDDPFAIEVASVTAPSKDEIVSKGRIAYPVTWITNGISQDMSSATVFYTLGNSGIWKEAAGTVMDPLTGFSWDVPSPAKRKNAKLKVVFRDILENKVATAISSVFRIE